MAKKSGSTIPKDIIRITPEEIQESFVKTGYKPAQCLFQYKVGNKVDGLAAFWISKCLEAGRKLEDIIITESTPISGELVAYGGYDVNYLSGFTNGWDFGSMPDFQLSEYIKGYNDGRDAWKLVK
jgi:hypothetical protein